MAHDDRISFVVLETQQRIFRLAERDHGLSLKAISIDSGIPYNSVRGYAAGHTVLPVPAMLKLVDVIPDDLLSHLFHPVSRHIVPVAGIDGDLDELGDKADDLATEVRRSRHPKSPGGVDIVSAEVACIKGKAATLGLRVAS